MMSKFRFTLLISVLATTLLLQACSGNAFHLRNNVNLPAKYQQIQTENILSGNGFSKAFRLAIEEAGGQVLDTANTKIRFDNFREGKKVVAYTKERKARVYLLFLKFDYEIVDGKQVLPNRRINLDRTFIYDANFALGKAEEESQIRHDLYAEAARLILLRLQYAEK